MYQLEDGGEVDIGLVEGDEPDFEGLADVDVEDVFGLIVCCDGRLGSAFV